MIGRNSMKVYFTASARGKSLYYQSYRDIHKSIEDLGHKNLDDLILKINENVFYEGTHEEQVKLYENTINLIKKADVIVLEITVPSLSMGYVLHKAIEMNKPVIALYSPGTIPFFVQGIDSEKLQVLEYSSESLNSVLSDALIYAEESSDVRFNFFISPSIGHYLDWVSKVKKIPRSVYLRGLIEKDMAINENYGN